MSAKRSKTYAVPSALSALGMAALILVTSVCASTAAAYAQSPQAMVVMFSDIHFDPFHDPANAALLDKAPVAAWRHILDRPASAGQASRFAAVQAACNGKEGTDAPYALMHSSLLAAQKMKAARYVTVSGDLLVHDLDCRYRASLGLPPDTADDQSVSAAFAEKTAQFVMEEIVETFPHIPVYLALGNNDSRCNHNRMDYRDRFLAATSAAVMSGLRSAPPAEKIVAARTYGNAGYYAVTLPAPVQNTRLLVIDDVYMMTGFAGCSAANDHRGEQEQIEWMRKELGAARQKHQNVWVLGHLPPSINLSAASSAAAAACTTGKVTAYLTTTSLLNELRDNADLIKLAIFGHTHLDEFRVLRSARGSLPIKIVGAVTPLAGTNPSFTVGLVDPVTAALTNYTVYKTSSTSGIAADWTMDYSFRDAYGTTAFTGAELEALTGRLKTDGNGSQQLSQTLQSHIRKGAGDVKSLASWQAYSCGLDNDTAATYQQCMCTKP